MENNTKNDQNIESKALVQIDSKTVDLDTFKSVYYLLNAKPDTDIKVFWDDKKICFRDILDLNYKVQEKIRNHQMVTNITKVTVVLSNNRVQEFTTWAEFERYDWDIPAHTQTITVFWEMNFLLPHHTLPQPHSMQLRLGSSVKPQEMFHLLISKESYEIKESFANAVCKIDFINSVICNELFVIVGEWHKCLPNLETYNKFQKLLFRHPSRIEEFIKLSFLFSSVFILLSVTHYFAANVQIISTSVEFYEKSYKWVGFSFLFVYTLYMVGKVFALWVLKTMKKLNNYPIFGFTKGDKNKLDSLREKNNKLLGEIFFKLSVSGLIFLMGIFFKYIIKLIVWVF